MKQFIKGKRKGSSYHVFFFNLRRHCTWTIVTLLLLFNSSDPEHSDAWMREGKWTREGEEKTANGKTGIPLDESESFDFFCCSSHMSEEDGWWCAGDAAKLHTEHMMIHEQWNVMFKIIKKKNSFNWRWWCFEKKILLFSWVRLKEERRRKKNDLYSTTKRYKLIKNKSFSFECYTNYWSLMPFAGNQSVRISSAITNSKSENENCIN